MAIFPNRQIQAQFEAELRHRINAGRVAVQAQTALFARQFGQVVSEWKADHTRVTFADFAIAENVFALLQRDFSNDDYCSEEANPSDEVLSLNAKFAWVIDPIDGTNNYALGFPICAISLALLHDGVPVYGFIYDYSSDSLLEGGAGFGLQCNQQRVHRDRMAANAQSMLGLHFPMAPDLVDRLKPLLAKYRVRCLGSGTLNAAYVATGYLTGVVDFQIKVWDIAAAYALCAGTEIRFQFLAGSPFPLKRFHPQMGCCPYWAGTEYFCKELQALLG